MSTVIKATDRNAAVHGVVFNFDDMQVKASQYLEKIRAEAAQIVAQAEKDAGEIRRQAKIEGRKDAEQMVEQKLGQQLATLKPAMEQAIRGIHDAKQAWLSHWEKSAVHVAASIAGRLIRRRLPEIPDITLTLVREALELAAGSSQLRIQLNPADHEALQPQVKALVEELASLGTAEVVADDRISPGGCRVETRFGVIDQQFESQLERIEEELT